MLIVVPPSETKRRSPDVGEPVELDRLSFPELGATRRRVIEALIETCGLPDAFQRLHVAPSMVHDVAMNAHVLELPAMAAHELYTGPLHAGLDLGGLGAAGSGRAAREVVITSPLMTRLVGLDRTDLVWRPVLPEVLARAADAEGPIVDLRSAVSQSMGMPSGLAGRTATLHVDQGPAGHRIGDVVAKRVRGEAARHLLESGATPTDIDGVADILATRWAVRVTSGTGEGSGWTLTVAP